MASGELTVSEYDHVIGDQVCDMVAKGFPLAWCADAVGVPVAVLQKWARRHHVFREQYRQAVRQFREMLLQRVLSRPDSARWFLERMDPEVFGKRATVTHEVLVRPPADLPSVEQAKAELAARLGYEVDGEVVPDREDE